MRKMGLVLGLGFGFAAAFMMPQTVHAEESSVVEAPIAEITETEDTAEADTSADAEPEDAVQDPSVDVQNPSVEGSEGVEDSEGLEEASDAQDDLIPADEALLPETDDAALDGEFVTDQEPQDQAAEEISQPVQETVSDSGNDIAADTNSDDEPQIQDGTADQALAEMPQFAPETDALSVDVFPSADGYTLSAAGGEPVEVVISAADGLLINGVPAQEYGDVYTDETGTLVVRIPACGPMQISGVTSFVAQAIGMDGAGSNVVSATQTQQVERPVQDTPDPEQPDSEQPKEPEVPEVKVPETPEAPVPEEPKEPEVPEVKVPETPEAPAPEEPEQPSAPETKTTIMPATRPEPETVSAPVVVSAESHEAAESAKEHTKIMFVDDIANVNIDDDTTESAVAVANARSPRTGDESQMMLFAIIFAVSGASLLMGRKFFA